MESEDPQPKLETESQPRKEPDVEKKSLSRSSTGECDEWVLVNSLGNEVENSSCQVQQDVGTAANFVAPLLNKAAASLSINVTPSANAYCSTVLKPEILEEESEEDVELESDGAPKAGFTEDVGTIATATVVSPAKEKLINRDDSSETASQTSLCDHNEDILSSPEDQPSSMASSTASTDLGGYEMVSSSHSRADQTEDRREEDEMALPAVDDSLPVNFVQACSTRIRNYIHAYDLALNWKLSLLVLLASAAVLGLGLGHFIGSTHVWLSRQSLSRHQEEQLRTLETRLVECLHKLKQAEVDLGGGVTSSSKCKDDYCRVDENPTCPTIGNFESRLSGCLERMETCQDQLNVAEQERHKRSADMMKAFRDLRVLRRNLMQVHATYEKLSVMALEQQRLQQESYDSKFANEKEMEELSKKLKEAESREQTLIKQEFELRRMLSNLESTVGALKEELAKMKSQTPKRKQAGSGDSEPSTHGEKPEEPIIEDEDDGEFNSDFNWNRLSELFEQLKDSTKFNEVFETYFDIFKDLKLPEINVSKLWLDQLPSTLGEVASNLKQGVDEKVRELEDSLYATDWDQYVRKAKDVTNRVGETVGTLWQKAKDLSDHVREQHGERGEKILNEFKTTVEKAAKAFDKRWEQAARFWRDVVGTRDEEDAMFEESPEPVEDSERDDSHDQVWVYHENRDGEPVEEIYAETRSRDEDGIDEQSSWTKAEDVDDLKYTKVDSNKFSGADASNDVKQLREALKSSFAFSRYVTDEFADHYFRRLKQASRALMRDDDGDHSAWWLCQKLWWTRHSFAYGRQCSDKLMSWQRHVRVDVDVRQKLIDETPRLKWLLQKFAADSETPKPSGDGPNWMFEWAKTRREMRREDEERENADKKSWMTERWRRRDQMRHQEDFSSAASKWLFRRGKEREKKRDNEYGDYWQRRSRMAASGKEKNSFNSRRRQ